MSQHQKGKTNLDLLEQETVSGSGISWDICNAAPHPSWITMPAPHHSVFLQTRCPSCRPTKSIRALGQVQCVMHCAESCYDVFAGERKVLGAFVDVFISCFMKVIRQMDPKNNPSITSTPPDLSLLKSQLNDKEKYIQQIEVHDCHLLNTDYVTGP